MKVSHASPLSLSVFIRVHLWFQFSSVVADAPDLDSGPPEVHQQADSQTRGLQVVQTLGEMHVVEGPHGLEFDPGV